MNTQYNMAYCRNKESHKLTQAILGVTTLLLAALTSLLLLNTEDDH